MGHSAHWRSLAACLRVIHSFTVGFKDQMPMAELHSMRPEASTINEFKSTKGPGLCFRCGGPHFQNRFTKHINQPNNRSQSTSPTRENYKKIGNLQNSMTIETTIAHSLQEPYHFKLPSKLNPAMTFHLVSTPSCTFLGK